MIENWDGRGGSWSSIFPVRLNVKKTLSLRQKDIKIKTQALTTQLRHRGQHLRSWWWDDGPGAACSSGPWHTRVLCWRKICLVEIKMNRNQCWVETCIFNQKLHLFPNLCFPLKLCSNQFNLQKKKYLSCFSTCLSEN